MRKHADEAYAASFDFDRLTPTSAAGTGQLLAGETLTGTPTVTIAKRLGKSRIDVTSEFIAENETPALAAANTKVTVNLKKATTAGEQIETAEPYEIKAECDTSLGNRYVLPAELEVVNAGRV